MTTFMLAWVACLAVFCSTHVLGAKDDFYVNITILETATAQGAGGSDHMGRQSLFDGILHNTSIINPGEAHDIQFYNCNRVRVKYCDGSSFTGDVEQVDPENKLYFRGARIFKAIVEDLWSKGMKNSENAILSGTSAGGLPTILNCDKFKCLFPKDARVKCVADAGFFINGSGKFIKNPPPLRPTVDDDFSDYENDGNHPINTEDDSMHTEAILSNSQDDEEDRGTRSQSGLSFTDGINFYLDQTFVEKKELKMLLDAAAVRQSFDNYLENNCSKLLKEKCLSRGCGWLLRAMKYKTSCKFCIYKYVRHINIANAFSHVYSHAHHGLCMRHLTKNMRVNQHCGEHVYLFYAAAKAYTIDEFSEHFAELKNNRSKATHVLENMLGFEKWS
ncbi:hypothetical protein BC332_19081 [Capsicum chinense]|nr:hypothetical protein BC332_19081 [Capsicum chinense]